MTTWLLMGRLLLTKIICISYQLLTIHSYFQEVLATNQIDTEIQLHKDGSWSTHVNKTESTVLDTPIKPPNKVEIICDDLG